MVHSFARTSELTPSVKRDILFRSPKKSVLWDNPEFTLCCLRKVRLMTSRLRLRTVTAREKTIVMTRGDIDLTTVAALDDQLARLARQQRQLIVNLSHTYYVDSTALASLLRTHKSLSAVGGRLHVVGCQPSVSRVLHMVGFQHLFIVHDHQARESRTIDRTPVTGAFAN